MRIVNHNYTPLSARALSVGSSTTAHAHVSKQEVDVPLSEHEQNMLEQMERALYAEDPRFATQMKGATKAHTRRRIVVGMVVAAVGLGCVVAGIAMSHVVLGGVGFAAMVAGVAWAVTPHGKGAKKPAGSASLGNWAGKKPTRPRSAWMASLEQRWERRRREG